MSAASLTRCHADCDGHGGGESKKTDDNGRQSAHGTSVFKGMFGQ